MSKHEILATSEKIREKYQKYIDFYHKSSNVLLDFERRYTQAVLSGMNLELFIKDEIIIIDTLNRREEEKLQAEHKPEIKRESYADRVINEYRARMEKYPKISLHVQALPDIVYLYGALNEFEKNYWSQLSIQLGVSLPALRNSKLVEVEHSMYRLTNIGKSGIPSSLEKYRRMMQEKPLPVKQVESESQSLIKDAAFLLHEIKKMIMDTIKKGNSTPLLEKSLELIQNIINDFRLKDIKKEDQ